MGGSSNDKGFSVATDIIGNVFVTGHTGSLNFPIGAIGVNNIQQPVFGGGSAVAGDAFALKFDPTGVRLWATFYGGSDDDEGKCITTDLSGNLIITGYTKSANFPVGFCCGNMVEQPIFGGSYDAFVVKFNSTGILLWATFYGVNVWDWGWSVTTDLNNNIYLLMEAEEVATPALIDVCSYQPVFNGGSSTNPNGGAVEDLLIVKFSPFGKKVCATYLGGTGEDDLEYGGDIAIFGNSMYITASTNGGYPVTTNAFQTTYAGPLAAYYSGGTDGFVASLCINICESKTLGLNYFANNTSVCVNAPVTFIPSVSNACDTTGYRFKWIFTGGNPSSSDSVKPTVKFSGIGPHDVKLVLTTNCKKDSITKVNYITVNSCGCALVASVAITAATCGNSNGTATANTTGGNLPNSYTWSSGQTSQTATGLATGNYTVSITDAGGCTATGSVVIPASPILTGQFSKGTGNCAECGCKEWIFVTANGGTSPYTYVWTDGYDKRYKNHQCPGNYTINIKDKNGCSINVNITTP